MSPEPQSSDHKPSTDKPAPQVSFALSLGNVPRLKRPFLLSEIMVKVGAGEYLSASKIMSSERDSTKVSA
jgi:hypothetical protein